MSLLEKIGMIKVYCKKIKKSIHLPDRLDVFLLLALLILIISPFVINYFVRLNAERKQINLYLSPRFVDFFGEDLTNTLLREFEGENPDLKIRILNDPDREADIFIFDEGEFSGFAASESLINLSPYSSRRSIVQQRAVPLVSFMDLLFYNIELLETLGFDRPPKTREEFLAYARAGSYEDSTRHANMSGTAFSLSPQDRLAMSRDIFSWIWASGNDFWHDENRPVLNAAASSDLSFLRSLYNDRVLAYGIFDSTGEQRLREFAQGRIVMMIASAGAIPFLRESMGDDAFGITNIPGSGLGGRYSAGLSGIYAGINVNSSSPDKAWAFVSFLAEQSPLFCEMFKAIPGMLSEIIPGDYVKDDPFYSKAWDIYESSRIVNGFLRNPDAEKYENAFLEEMQAFFRSTRPPQETITAIQQRWDAITGQ